MKNLLRARAHARFFGHGHGHAHGHEKQILEFKREYLILEKEGLIGYLNLSIFLQPNLNRLMFC
jgi:hypothetical protein